MSYSTIAAISTPVGAGGVGIIRISGPKAHEIGDAVFKGKKRIGELDGYSAALGYAWDNKGKKLDRCIALCFRAPKSYTGEDVAELSCHGGVYVLNTVLKAVYDAGAVPADPGEFTKRAFLNGKMDLTQAEAVMELISATGERAREAAMSAGEGRISKETKEICKMLVKIGSDLSAWADYPDDDIPQVDEEMLKAELKLIDEKLTVLEESFDKGRIYRDGINTVIAGRPNAGKSTLMNLLAGYDRSIVTNVPGTTRDVVEDRIMLGDIPLLIADTAGIRSTNDPVEAIGVKLAWDRVNSAELVLVVFDSAEELTQEEKKLLDELCSRPFIAVVNKSDLQSKIDLEYIKSKSKYLVYISALNNSGTGEIERAVKEITGSNDFVEGAAVIFTHRQQDAVKKALNAVKGSIEALEAGVTLDAVTVTVEEALESLLELRGEKAGQVIIDSVFERFCVGK